MSMPAAKEQKIKFRRGLERMHGVFPGLTQRGQAAKASAKRLALQLSWGWPPLILVVEIEVEVIQGSVHGPGFGALLEGPANGQLARRCGKTLHIGGLLVTAVCIVV